MNEQVEKNNNISLEDILELRITKDQLTAYLLFKPSSSDSILTKTELLEFIKQNGIDYGLQDNIIDSFIQSPQNFVGEEFAIAIGVEPIKGEDSYLEMVYQQSKNKKPKENEDGSVDFYSITEISNVEKGQLLAKKIPPTAGTSGRTVTNLELPTKDGRDFPIKAGKNVVVDGETQAIYSLIAGQVSITENGKVNVFPIYEVNGDLDFEIGNIDFIGNVIIRGSVPSGFKINAKGDIRITGGVEGAELEAGGSIHIQSGITAQHKGFVKAGKDVNTSFIVNGVVQAQENIKVSQSIMHSQITAGGNIECGGPKGLIVGGVLQAGNSLLCRTIGNSMTTPTAIEVGSNPKLSNRLKEIKLEINELDSTLTKTVQALQVLDLQTRQLGKLSPEKKGLQIKLENSKLQIEKKQKELKGEKADIEEELQEEVKSCIEVTGIIYPGTKLVFGKYIKYIKDNQQRIRYILDQREIVGKSLV
jgi:uncharacterized protein (DUF342 family)